MNPRDFGRDSWAMLHLTALRADADSSFDHRGKYSRYIELFAPLVQCVYCRNDATSFVDTLATRATDPLPIAKAVEARRAFAWSVELHNMVNRKIATENGTSVTDSQLALLDARRLWEGQRHLLFKSVWSYLTIVFKHYDAHGSRQKQALYTELLDVLPALLGWFMCKGDGGLERSIALMCDVALGDTCTSSNDMLRRLVNCALAIGHITNAEARQLNTISDTLRRLSAKKRDTV